jgi:hypothetical protein
MDSKAIKNYITPSIVKWLGILYRQKLKPYALVMILKDLVLYSDGIINLETRLVQVNIKGRDIIMNFNILLLGQDKAVLGMIWLREYNLKINWITG